MEARLPPSPLDLSASVQALPEAQHLPALVRTAARVYFSFGACAPECQQQLSIIASESYYQFCFIGLYMWLGMDCGNRAGTLQEHQGAGALEMEARLPPSLSAALPCTTACAGSLLVIVRPGILLLEMCMEGCDINVTTRYTWTSRLLFV